MNSQECKIRPQLTDINSNEPSFYSYSIRINKCSGSCNSINDPYAKVFNLMSKTNDRRHIKWHETCKCKCRLDESVCNDKQRLNKDKCRYECKELIDKEICEKGFIWNPSNCSCECDRLSDVGEYLEYKNCKCRLVELCSENIDENEMIYNGNNYGEVRDSCTIYIVFLVILLVISISISSVFIYFHW